MSTECALLALLLAAGPLSPPAARPGATAPVASLPTASGEVLSVDHRAHVMRLRSGDVELELGFDRNTLVVGPAGGATVAHLTPGMHVRVGRDGPGRAAWIEMAPAPSTPQPAP